MPKFMLIVGGADLGKRAIAITQTESHGATWLSLSEDDDARADARAAAATRAAGRAARNVAIRSGDAGGSTPRALTRDQHV
jgi:hypothetical protein